MIKEPKQFATFEDLPEWMQDRQDAIEAQRSYAWRVAHDLADLSKRITTEMITSMQADKQMVFTWWGIQELIRKYAMLCEYSRAVELIEQELKDLHESQADGNPF